MSPFGSSFLPQPVVYSQPFNFVGPLFSHSYGLFVVPKTVNSFAIKQIRTLCAKYRGLSVLCVSALSFAIDFVSLCFQDLTNPFSRNPFPFTSIQNPRGVWGVFLSGCSRVTGHGSQSPSSSLLFAPLDDSCALLYLPLESTLAKVYQNKQLYLSLESTLMKKQGEGGIAA